MVADDDTHRVASPFGGGICVPCKRAMFFSDIAVWVCGFTSPDKVGTWMSIGRL